MAEVYLAKQTGLVGFEKLVVIKQILPHLSQNDEFVRMFLDEARTAADLRHPNVVQIYEIGEDAGTYFIAMEFLHGQDVRRVMRRQAEAGGGIPLAHALQTVIDAAGGLDYAHKKQDLSGQPLGIIHRDISPQNIIVTYDGTAKIVDFGIAKAASQSVETKSGVLKGKYSYMSPEQASGEHIDQRTDQFALGIVLYEMTTMSRLFKFQNEIMTLHAITECAVKPPGTLVPDYPPALADIVMRSLSKRREDRFKDCRALADALEEFLAENRVVHSPARVGAYMQELFREQLDQEQALGQPVIDHEASGSASRPTTRSKRRPTSGGGSSRQTPPPPSQSTPRPVSQAAGTAVTRSQVGPSTTRTHPRDGPSLRRSQPPAPADPADLIQAEPTQATAATGMVGVGDGLTGIHGSGRRSLLGLALVFLLVLAGAAGGAFMVLRPSAVGRVAVVTVPDGARVVVDGQPHAERTPTVVGGLPVGRAYAVRLEMPGYAPVLRDIRVTGAETVEVRVTLEREKPGTLVRFRSTPPGARVYLDGRPLEGVTPMDLPDLPLDGEPHVATFSLDGHADETRRFHLMDGVGVQDVSVSLLAADAAGGQGRIRVTSTPPGAAILVGGKPVGVSPVGPISVAGDRSHPVVAKLAGYQVEERLVDVEAGANVEVAFELEKERPQETGLLTLDSTPEVSVFTDKGRLLGKTPLRKVRVPAGSYTLRLVNEKRGLEHLEKVKVEVAKETKVAVTVPKGRLKVVVRSWAHVYVDGVKVGTTPFAAKEFYVGKHEVRLVNEQLQKDEREVVVIRANDDARVKRDW
jgi:serine/threonine protein kinase